MALPPRRADVIRGFMENAASVREIEREMTARMGIIAASAQARLDILSATAVDWISPAATDLYIPRSDVMTAIPGMAYSLDSQGYALMAFFSCELYNTSNTVGGECVVALSDAGTIYTPGMRQSSLGPLDYASVGFEFAWRPPAGTRTVQMMWACAAGMENLIRCTGGRMQLTLLRLAFGSL